MPSKLWEKLKQGDIVDLIATGYGVKSEDLPKYSEVIRSLGLIPRIPDDLLGEDLFCSNRQEIRQKHLINALTAEDSKAIWCIKGGYGTSALLPELYKLQQPLLNKLVIGFSDITVLHLFLNNHWGWASVHGTVLFNFVEKNVDETTLNKTKDLIFGRVNAQKHILTPLNLPAKKLDHPIGAPVTGGNLKLITTSIGTKWQLKGENRILMLEDVDEASYRVERMLLQLKQSEILNGVVAILMGEFRSDKGQEDQEKMKPVSLRFAENSDIPIYEIDGIGHSERNYPMPLGTMSQIIPDGTFRIETSSGYK
jgi:muramoyltetrapeptide carboxypeptidase